MDPYATHLSVIVDEALRCDGPILEMGCGHYSTPVLAAIARSRGIEHVALSSSEEWSRTIAAAYFVDIEHVANWTHWQPPLRSAPWGLVLLDNEESVNDRIKHLPLLAHVARVVVVHDADVALSKQHWSTCAADFDIEVWRLMKPWTATLRSKALASRVT